MNGISSSPASWNIGEQATVVYETHNPASAKVLSYFGIFGWAVAWMAIALPLIVIGGGYYFTQGLLM